MNDYCHAKLRLISISPVYAERFTVFYSLGLISASGEVDIMTDIIKASSSDLIASFGDKVEIFSRGKLMGNKARYIVDDAVTIVCQVGSRN